MNYEMFCIRVKERIQEIKGEDAQVYVQKTLKNNGQELMGLIIKEKDGNIVPNLFLESFFRQYECGTCFEDILEKILAAYDEYQWKEYGDFSFFLQYENVKDRIVYKLISKEHNEEFLKKVPWFPVLDLALVFYYILPEYFQIKASITVDNSHLKIWEVDKNELYEAAYNNTPKLLPVYRESIRATLENLLEESEGSLEAGLVDEMKDNILNLPEEETGMYVLSNKIRIFGAASLLYPHVLQDFAKEVDADLFVLPSSIHEVLLMPNYGGFSVTELQRLVQDVNENQVEQEERLSDNVYYYHRKTGRLIPADRIPADYR